MVQFVEALPQGEATKIRTFLVQVPKDGSSEMEDSKGRRSRMEPWNEVNRGSSQRKRGIREQQEVVH